MADTKPPCLTVLGGPMAGNRFVLQDGMANVLIGSDPVCGFHLPVPGVSAMHARVAVDSGGVSIWEAGSPRGLHVNDSRVEGSAPLHNGDIVWLGTPGDEDVVMLQCILPRLPSPVSTDAPAAEAASSPAGEDADTVRLDPRSLSLEPESPTPAPVAPLVAEPEPPPVADPEKPLAQPLMSDTPVGAHFASVYASHEPEEAGLVVEADAESFVKAPHEPPVEPPRSPEGQDFALADEGMPLTIQEPAPSYTPPEPEPAPAFMPPGFEDETEDRVVVVDTEISEPQVMEPTDYMAATDFTLPPASVPAPQAPPVAAPRPAPPAPVPTPPAARPTPSTAPPTAPSRPARPASVPPSRKPATSSLPPRTEAQEKAGEPPATPATSSPIGLYVGLGIAALVVLGGGAFVALKMMGGKAPAVAQATPAPVTPSAAPTQAPVIPVVEPTPTPDVPTPTPVVATPVVPTPTPVPTPTGRPTPTPSPAKPGAPTPTPPVVATPTGPSPEQVRAQQVAGFLTQAEAAMGARQYDQAIGHFDEVLKLEPGNAKATAERASAIAARDAGRRRFVAGRTVVTTDKAAGGGISGFEGAAVQKAPDFQGRIEFEMSPATGLKAGDPWTLKLFVVNEGKKAIRITDLQAQAIANGERTGGAASAKAREIAPQARVQIGEMAGAWKDGTQTWSAEVLLTAKGDSLKNTLTWK